jgi:hypothetical protein
VKRTCRTLPLFALLLLFCLAPARAQSAFDVAVGFGSQFNSSLGQIDINTLGPCTSTSSGTCSKTPDLSGFFMGINGNLMLWKHFGLGAGATFQPAKKDYIIFQQGGAGQFGDILQERTTFYDFNAIFEPISTTAASVQLIGGIGGANVKFYEKVSSNSSVLGNSQYTQFFGSSNHFALHGAVAVPFYVRGNIFIKPQLDIRYITNFDQFKRNMVPGFMVWVGYSFGDRQ